MRPGVSQKRSGACQLIVMIASCCIVNGTAGEVKCLGDSDRDCYSVGDTRIIDIDLASCYGMTLTVYQDQSFVNATLYALSKPPSLTARDPVNDTLDADKALHPDFFYLYPGSNFSITACWHSAPYHVYVIKGQENFRLWLAGKRGPSVVAYACYVTFSCSSSPPPKPNCEPAVEWPITITAADDWYFAAAVDKPYVRLYLERFEYMVKDSDIISSCNAGGSKPGSIESCTVAKTQDVTTYLLKIGPGESHYIVEATTTCASYIDTTGMIAGLWTLGTFSAVLLIACAAACFCCCYWWKCRTKGKDPETDTLIQK